MSVWVQEGRVAAGRPVPCLPWDISFPRQILLRLLLQARPGPGPGIYKSEQNQTWLPTGVKGPLGKTPINNGK